MTPFRFRAEAAIPAAKPGALSAGYTSDKLPCSYREVWRSAFSGSSAYNHRKNLYPALKKSQEKFVLVCQSPVMTKYQNNKQSLT